MKTKIIFVVLMMLGISTTFANYSRIRAEVVLSHDKSLVSEIAITETIQPGRMTIVYDTLQTFKVSKDAQPWITPDLAQQLVDVWNDKNMYANFIWLPENIKIYPKWTKLFVHKYTEIPHKLVISKGIISYEVVNSMRYETKTKLYITNILILCLVSLLCFIFALISLFKKFQHETIIWTVSITIFILIIINYSNLTILDYLLNVIVGFGPAYLSTFLFFQKKIRKHKLEKNGWQIDKPLGIFKNGDILLKRNIAGSLNYVGFFDKKYHMKKEQLFDTIEETKFESYIIKNFDNLYGLVDKELNEILKIKYPKIFKLKDADYIEVREKKHEKGQIFCTRTNKFVDADGYPISDG